MSTTTANRRGHAVIIGGGLTGLLAARVLDAHYERVTVIERDHYPAEPAFRKGVPQAHQFHMLWANGLDLIERLLPGVTDELIRQGAVPIDLPSELLWLSAAGWSHRFPSAMRILSVTRPVIDWAIRARVDQCGGIRFETRQEVTGLLADRQAGAVTGVRLRARDRTGSWAELSADLVVDASGRGSRMPDWLAALGIPGPQEITVDSNLGYASRQFAVPDHFDADWKALLVHAKAPDFPRGGNLFRIENGRWMATLVGAAGDHPPVDDDGFLEFAAGLRSPLLYESIRDARPLSPVRGYRRTANRRRRYEALPDMPDRLVVLGDAACALNPLYAHGMTVAALEATAMRECLESAGGHGRGLSRRIQRRIAGCTKAAWMIATGEDLKYPTTTGAGRGLQQRLTGPYLDKVARAACGHPAVAGTLLNVLNLATPPEALFRPGVAVPALLGRAGPATEPPLRLTGDDQLSAWYYDISTHGTLRGQVQADGVRTGG